MSEVLDKVSTVLNFSVLSKIKEIRARNSRRQPLENGVYQLDFSGITEDMTEEEILKVAVFVDGNVSIELGTILGWIVADPAHTDMYNDVANDKVLTTKKGKVTSLHQYLLATQSDLPASIEISGRLYNPAGPEYLEGDKGAARTAVYEAMEIAIDGEVFPQVILRRKELDATEVGNWTLVNTIGVKPPTV